MIEFDDRSICSTDDKCFHPAVGDRDDHFSTAPSSTDLNIPKAAFDFFKCIE